MRTLRPRGFERVRAAFCVLLAFMLVCVGTTQSVAALTDKQINLYSQNSIFLYDPEADCIKMEKGKDNKINDYDGHCTNVKPYYDKLEEYHDQIRRISEQNGLPWEAIMAQLIGESGFMKNEVCPFNPLGLTGQPSCDGKHRTFDSYEEAFNYYVNNIVPVRAAMGKFKDDPYGFIDFIINGGYGKYATDPNYINKISGYICGIQGWAKDKGLYVGSEWDGSTNTDEGVTDSEPYCREEDDDDDDDEEDDYDCVKEGTCNDWVFPLAGATKSNYMHGSALSPLPCKNLSKGGCHHDYWAMDLGLNTGTKTENDFPDLKGLYGLEYWKSVGVKVVAMTSGKIISYKTYRRATQGYESKCASVIYETNDGRKFWLGHMLYDSRYKAGDSFTTGAVIGEVGPPPCAVGTQAHLHVDETITHGDDGTVETVELINMLYEKLP